MKSKIINGCKYWGQLFLLPIYWLSFLFPRDQKLWLFGSTFGRRFADNPRYLYLYVSQHSDRASDRVKQEMAKWQAAGHAYAEDENCKDIRAVWITHKKEIAAFLTEEGYEAYYYHSLKGIYLALRAGIYIYDNYSKDINFWQSGGAVKFNLWHGIPLKKIQHDNIHDRYRHPKNAWEKFLCFPRNLSDEKPGDYVLTTAKTMKGIFRSAFQTRHVVSAGYPRVDSIAYDTIQNIRMPEEKKALRKIAKRKEQLGCQKVVLYMPTFRDSETEFFFMVNPKRLEQFLEKEQLLFCIKPHSKSKETAHYKAFCQKHMVYLEAEFDPYVFLKRADLLITDYSSIYFDYLFLDRPVVFFHYDMQQYLKDSREFYFEYEEMTPGRHVKTEEALLEGIRQSLGEPQEYAALRREVKQKVYDERTHMICNRLVRVMRKKMLG